MGNFQEKSNYRINAVLQSRHAEKNLENNYCYVRIIQNTLEVETSLLYSKELESHNIGNLNVFRKRFLEEFMSKPQRQIPSSS